MRTQRPHITTALSYGIHTVRVLLARTPRRVRRLWLSSAESSARLDELRELAHRHSVEVLASDDATLDRMAGGGRHQGAIAEIEAPGSDPETTLELAFEAAQGPPLVLVLDGVQDPHNLGACLRSADAAGATVVIAPRDRATGITPVVRKVAAGAAESLPFAAVVNLARTLRDLRERGLWVVGMGDDASKSLYDVDLTGPIAIVMGAEGDGLRRLTRETCDEIVSLPMAGVVESLNVSVAAGVALYEAVRQRRKSMFANASALR